MYIVALALSVLIGLALGLLGGGGSMLTTPILLYAMELPGKEAMATSLVVVGATSAAAMIQHARAGNVSWRTGVLFGVPGMFGAYRGGRLAAGIPESALLLAFGGMMLGTAAAMYRGRKDTPTDGEVRPALWKIMVGGLLVGVVPGLLGAGGGFLIVPALVLLAGLPMRQAVGTSLLVITLNSVAGYFGQASHVTIDAQLAASVSLAAVGGSVVGGRLGRTVPQEALRRIFAGFIFGMGLFVIFKQL